MKVAIYLRVSTEEQRERQSIATQRDFAARYCALHELAVHATYADDGVSGTVPLDRRPEGLRMLKEARLKQFDQILVYRLDRLGRDTRQILNSVDEFEKCGIRVKSLSEEFDTATATGRLMLTLLSGFAAHERDVIRERSVAGTNRVVEAGAWLGGIVPYGYRKEGQRSQSRLVVTEEKIAGVDLSEADVVREIYRMAAEQGKSCQKIARWLNDSGAPCAYVRDERLLLRGKRKVRTSGVWRPGRVRNLIVNTTYRGEHIFGKRSCAKNRQLISRPVPAIVTAETWNKAQQTLTRNFIFCKRNSREQYLLRGLIKCELCNRNFSGSMNSGANRKKESYYRCNGKLSVNGSYAKDGHRCPAKEIRGEYLEALVWSDVEHFLRNPGDVLERLRKKMATPDTTLEDASRSSKSIEDELTGKLAERERVISLFRRARIDEASLELQLAEIGNEEAALKKRLDADRTDTNSAQRNAAHLHSAESLLRELANRLDQPISWDFKRRVVEVLVAGIRVDTKSADGEKTAMITVSYRFEGTVNPSDADGCLFAVHSGKSEVRRAAPGSLGHHLRKKRLSLGLLRKDLATRLGVHKGTIQNWEGGIGEPNFEYVPKIIEFLGHNPLASEGTISSRLRVGRRILGISQRELAERLVVDPSTLAKWERGHQVPSDRFADRVSEFLSSAVSHNLD